MDLAAVTVAVQRLFANLGILPTTVSWCRLAQKEHATWTEAVVMISICIHLYTPSMEKQRLSSGASI